VGAKQIISGHNGYNFSDAKHENVKYETVRLFFALNDFLD